MYNNKINVENDMNNIVTVTNTNIRKYEKLAAGYANSAKRDMQECASYLALVQRVLRDCETIKNSINTTLQSDLLEHIEDIDNPHQVSAEQLNVYTKDETDSLIPDVSIFVEKETGKGLSENDYTNAEKTKLAGLSNYDDSTIRADIQSLGSAISSLQQGEGTELSDIISMILTEASGLSEYSD